MDTRSVIPVEPVNLNDLICRKAKIEEGEILMLPLPVG